MPSRCTRCAAAGGAALDALLTVPPFDLVLGVTLAGIAARALLVRDLFQGIVLFIVFGLLMSLAWTRLHAADVALAEAAIGAGLTGALFLNALAQSEHAPVRAAALPATSAALRVSLFFVGGTLALVLGMALAAPPAGAGLRDTVDANLAASGASNPVTAVLLNFRAYDTLLEIAVLIVAVLAVWALGPAPPPRRHAGALAGPVLLGLVRVLVPLIVVVAGYLLWIGTSAPGGAFQAGAVLGAAGVLLIVSGILRPPSLGTWAQRALIVQGFAVFLAVALAVMAAGGGFLEYPRGLAVPLILLIETLLTISIAAILVALFAGGPQDASSAPGGE